VSYALSSFVSLCQKGLFDIIFCGHLHLAPLAVFLARLFRVPIWLQLHGIEAWVQPSPIFRWATEQATLITAVSRYTRRKFLGWANVSPEKVRVLPNTVGDKFTPGPRAKEVIEKYKLQGKKVLLTSGRMSQKERYKGHDKVISILPELLQKHPDLIYVIAGNGDDRPRLETLARDVGLRQSILFVGRVSSEELVNLYRVADVFVMPSTGEGFGIVFLEALACGTPVIGGNQDGSVDPLHNGMLGSTVSPDKLFESIENALNDNFGNRDRMSETVRGFFGRELFKARVAQLSADLPL